MEKLRLYQLAQHELLRRRDFEESRLLENPNYPIAQHRLKQIDIELDEIHEIISKEENK